jgi:hypothetical protein
MGHQQRFLTVSLAAGALLAFLGSSALAEVPAPPAGWVPTCWSESVDLVRTHSLKLASSLVAEQEKCLYFPPVVDPREKRKLYFTYHVRFLKDGEVELESSVGVPSTYTHWRQPGGKLITTYQSTEAIQAGGGGGALRFTDAAGKSHSISFSGGDQPGFFSRNYGNSVTLEYWTDKREHGFPVQVARDRSDPTGYRILPSRSFQ